MDSKKFGAFLRSLRKEQGLTQEALAEILNVSNKTVSRWETGASMPDIDMLIILSSLYSISIGELLGGERRQTAEQELMPDAEPETPAEPSGDQAQTLDEPRALLKKVNDYSRAQSVHFAARFALCILLAVLALVLTAFVGAEAVEQVNGGWIVVIVPIFSYSLYTLGSALSPQKKRYAALNKINIGSFVLALNAIITHLVFFPDGKYHNYGLMGGYFAIILVFILFFSVRLIIKLIKVVIKYIKYRFFHKP